MLILVQVIQVGMLMPLDRYLGCRWCSFHFLSRWWLPCLSTCICYCRFCFWTDLSRWCFWCVSCTRYSFRYCSWSFRHSYSLYTDASWLAPADGATVTFGNELNQINGGALLFRCSTWAFNLRINCWLCCILFVAIRRQISLRYQLSLLNFHLKAPEYSGAFLLLMKYSLLIAEMGRYFKNPAINVLNDVYTRYWVQNR